MLVLMIAMASAQEVESPIPEEFRAARNWNYSDQAWWNCKSASKRSVGMKAASASLSVLSGTSGVALIVAELDTENATPGQNALVAGIPLILGTAGAIIGVLSTESTEYLADCKSHGWDIHAEPDSSE